MKKSNVFIIAGLMTLSLVGCGGSGQGQQASTAAGTEASGTEAAGTKGAGTETAPAAGSEASSEAKASSEAAPATDSSDTGSDEAGAAGGAQIANPWTDCTEDEAYGLIPNSFSAPEGAKNVAWSRMDSNEPTLVQMTFDLEGDSFTAREQVTGDEAKDISGMHYDWVEEDEVTLANWGGGNMKAKTYRYVGEDEFVDLCTWYDTEIGISYSLSVVAPDLAGFDIQAVVEAMYDENKQAGASIPPAVAEHKPMDITDCDTFTQIVDKLPADAGFANATIDGVDVLLVAEAVYGYDENGTNAAIDADVYYYDKDGVPTYAGYVFAGGTAYPLSIGDGKLYVGGNHFIGKMTLQDGKMVYVEDAHVEYDGTGAATYYYRSDTQKVEADEKGQVADDTVMNRLYDEFDKAEMIVFSKAG
ncbi:MAG: hypothetical protein K5989_01165 [Lachnospiraceae bacterium]|nr:hypothetical protein [Lachnospiraceae bacterium]